VGVADVSTRTYWLDLFSPTTWWEFLEAGGTVSGFRESRWNIVRQIKPGDYLLCYLTQVSRFIGVLEVVSDPYLDTTPSVWKDEYFPCRVNVEVVASVPVEAAVPISELSDQLSFFQNMTGLHAWTGRVRGSPTRWSESDGESVALAVLEAQAHPVVRPVDPRKLAKKPPVVETKIGPVTVPAEDEQSVAVVTAQETASEPIPEATAHTEIQWRLLKLGSDMGLDVWVARNDRSREYDGQRFCDVPRLRHALPNQFEEATNRTVELIDVLWLKGNAFIAAFEIESTTSIYSGLLRMADLLAMQPNLTIPLYLVAPDERRNKVLSEVNRPTFSRLSPPLKQVCRFLSFSVLRDQLPADPRVVRNLTPAFMKDFSESCEIEAL
jgi:predicted RNA-binding protein